MITRPLFILVFAAFAITAAVLPAGAYYTITPIDTASPMYTASDLNDAGQVVGNYIDDAGQYAFIWQNGSFTTLPGSSGGDGINNSGQVAGYTADEYGNGIASRWNGGSWSPLGTLGGSYSYAWGINSFGTVVGYSADAGGLHQSFIQHISGEMTSLGNLGSVDSYAFAINDSDQVVGYSQNEFWVENAFLWENGEMQNLGTFGGLYSYAYDINNAGQVVGEASDESGISRAFIWNGEEKENIGASIEDGSAALGINSFGQVVGYTEDVYGDRRGFIWTEAAGMVDLNTLIAPESGWTILGASRINSSGQILAVGNYNGEDKYILMAVPEPSGIASVFGLLTGAAGMYLRRRRG